MREIMRVTVVVEYAVDPDMYPGANTPAERAEIDLKNFEDDPELFAHVMRDPLSRGSIRVTSVVVE